MLIDTSQILVFLSITYTSEQNNGMANMAQSKYQTIPDDLHAQNQKMPVACR